MYTTLGQTQFQVLGMSYTSRGCIRLGRPLPLWNFEKKIEYTPNRLREGGK